MAWADPEAVHEEVQILEAMYPEELRLRSWPPRLALVIEGWEAEVELPDAYPYELPALRVEPPPQLHDAGEPEALAATVLSQLRPGEPLLVELAGLLVEEIGARHAALQSLVAEHASAEEEERLHLRELRDRQLAHDLAHSERSRALQSAEAWAAELSAEAQDEKKVGRFDFSGAGIATGETVTDRKSTFIAFLWPVSSRAEVDQGVAILKANGKIARAAHNMLAWRMLSPATGALVSECDSDGEGGAGGGLHALLHNTGAENVAVLVTRWYGGIHLGPDRFKHINNCARSLLVQHGYVADPKKKGRRK